MSAQSLPRRNPLATRGFTIIEVAMAATILVVGVMGMIRAITIGSEMMATARRQTLAAQIINHELEAFRFSSWATISGLSTGVTTLTINDQFNSAITAVGLTKGTTLTLSRTVANVADLTNVREITLTVTWTMRPSGASVVRTYRRMGSSYFGQYGLNQTYQRT
ncbi:MAG: hypothetical protein Q8J74_10620 [Candidatus Didemnitutus sp.]|nr:hypothetical protein [Candidatus Didemnitutus sp.]